MRELDHAIVHSVYTGNQIYLILFMLYISTINVSLIIC